MNCYGLNRLSDITFQIIFIIFLTIANGVFSISEISARKARLQKWVNEGTAMGGFNIFGSLGFAIGPFIGGLIADMYGFQVSFAVAGSAVLVIAIIFLPFLLKIKKNVLERLFTRKADLKPFFLLFSQELTVKFKYFVIINNINQ
ncbi:MAG: hypothetical protein C3F06_05365 [Candidatus Methanoperedenaceae archaeon]|nr:MAG: hypothetical protein C3F06_05365 [Candidatus Methanoperedenaceae archaeon]